MEEEAGEVCSVERRIEWKVQSNIVSGLAKKRSTVCAGTSLLTCDCKKKRNGGGSTNTHELAFIAIEQ